MLLGVFRCVLQHLLLSLAADDLRAAGRWIDLRAFDDLAHGQRSFLEPTSSMHEKHRPDRQAPEGITVRIWSPAPTFGAPGVPRGARSDSRRGRRPGSV